MPGELVPAAIAKEEALERVVKAYQRKELAEADWRKRRVQIYLKLGESIKAAMKLGLSAKQVGRAIGMSVPRVYQIRDRYRDHLTKEFADG